jgi:predicted RNA-binding protein YlqC (UPF0109 family)
MVQHAKMNLMILNVHAQTIMKVIGVKKRYLTAMRSNVLMAAIATKKQANVHVLLISQVKNVK